MLCFYNYYQKIYIYLKFFSQWGNDFRPAYRKIGLIRKMLKSTPIIALTATATPAVRQDILNSLNLIKPLVTVTSFDRFILFNYKSV